MKASYESCESSKISFTPEQIEKAANFPIDMTDWDEYARSTATNDGLYSAVVRSHAAWHGLAKCFWYSSHPHPYSRDSPPMLPNMPLRYDKADSIHERVNWVLHLGSLLQLLNDYDAYKAENPHLKQTDILSRSMWNTDMGFVRDFATYQAGQLEATKIS